MTGTTTGQHSFGPRLRWEVNRKCVFLGPPRRLQRTPLTSRERAIGRATLGQYSAQSSIQIVFYHSIIDTDWVSQCPALQFSVSRCRCRLPVSWFRCMASFPMNGWVQPSQPIPTPTLSSSLSWCLLTHAMPSLSSPHAASITLSAVAMLSL